MDEQRAVIDIGSNTVRLVIYGGPQRAPEVLHNEKVTARLGRGVAETGALDDKAMGMAVAALARFATILKLRGVTQFDTVATAAARDASNGPAFLKAVAELGLKPRLLSGEDEALTSAMGVMAAFPQASGTVADLGGGSLELISLDRGALTHGVSLPLGTLRLVALRAGGPAKFRRRIHRMLADAEWDRASGAPLYLVGGSFRAFAQYAADAGGWPMHDPHGVTLDAAMALKLARKLARVTQPPLVPGVSAARLAGLPDAAALLAALIADVAPTRLVFSAWGIREGVLWQAMPPKVRVLDPLIEGVAAFAARQGVDRRDGAAMSRWLAPLPITPPLPGEAIALLALALRSVEPNLREPTLREWALGKRWIGLDDDARIALAAALSASCTGTGPADAATRPAVAVGLAIRLARRLTGGAITALAKTTLTSDGHALTLAIPRKMAALVNDGVDRDLKALAAMLGLRPKLDLAG